MKILVTGGSGYLGTHVRRFFNADDFSRRSNLDILNQYDAERVADYDVVIHLAARLDKSQGGAEQSFRTNVEGTRNIVLKMRPMSTFIYASTKDVYGAHADTYEDAVPETCSTAYKGQSAFEWSKLIGERYAEYYGALNNVRVCIFRMSTVYARPSSGNENGFVTHYVEAIKHRLHIRLPSGCDPIRDILYVDDLSRACQAFIDSPHNYGLYNLGGGGANAASLRDIINRIGSMIELEPLIEESSSFMVPVPLKYISDLTHIREQLKWQPEVSIDDGLRMLL